MTIISTEMLKWKRNKTVLGIFILTAILGIFAVERAFSISRSSSLMNSFSDLYTLAFKNLTSLFLPIVLSMFATTLFFDEQKNDTLKGLLIIPISKTQLYFSKIAVVIFMSLALCLLTFAICILGGFLAGGFTDLNTETILQAGLLFLAGGVLVPLAMLPVIFLATLAKGYVLPIGAALLYLVPVVLIPSGIMGLHPLASVMGIYPYISSDAEVRDFIKTLSIERGKTILISSHILSEIALLADDIGIIDHGVLLEENSMNELQKKNSKYILLQVSDIPKTSLVLERQFGVTEYSVQDEHTLRIYDTSLDMAAVNKALVVQDIAVISSQLCNDTLEDYFKKITGGEGIA